MSIREITPELNSKSNYLEDTTSFRGDRVGLLGTEDRAQPGRLTRLAGQPGGGSGRRPADGACDRPTRDPDDEPAEGGVARAGGRGGDRDAVRAHHQLAKEALLHGKHVLVEKPLTTNVAEAEELIGLAAQQGRVLMVGHTFLYSPAVNELRKLIQDGDLGKIYCVEAERVNLGSIAMISM